MNKKIVSSILFSLFIFLGLFGLTKIVIGDLNTDVTATKVVLYGEGVYDNISMTKGGVSELVNLTIAATSGSYNITNITINLIGEGNYTFDGWVSTASGDAYEMDNNTLALSNVTEWADGSPALWTCTNASLYQLSCENSTLDALLDGAYNTSITLKFNVTAASNVEDVPAWNISTLTTDGEMESTVIYSYIDGFAPKLISLNVTDGNMTYVNDTETANFYEIDSNGLLKVYANIQEMNPDSNSVYLVMNNSGTNATDGVDSSAHVWYRMTQSASPGYTTGGVYTYTYTVAQMADAFNIGNQTNFVIVVNDTYNNLQYINGSATYPFSFTPNTTLVKVIKANFTTTLGGTTVTLTNPTSSNNWIAAGNATINIEVSGKEKGSLILYFKENGVFNANYANSISGESLIETLDATNISTEEGEGTTLYQWSIDFAGNHSNNPYVVLVINSTQTGNGDLSNLHNYSSFATYNFAIDGLTNKPTFTVPSSTTVTISDSTGITYTCNAVESHSGIAKYTWTLTKPNGEVLTFTDSVTSTSKSRTFSSSNIDRAGSYNLACKVTDSVGNEESSGNTAFTVTYQTVTGSSGGSGGSSGAITPTVSFDVDFTKVTAGNIRAQQGLTKSFSFDGSTKHTVTFDKVTASSVTITIASSPVTVSLTMGQTKEVDINGDGINDVIVKLVGVENGLANIEISKVEAGAQIVEKEEKEAAGMIVEEPTTTTPSGGATPVAKSSTWMWITLLVIVAIVGIGYYSYKKK
ncbi:MAG: hypothetical protein KKG75_02640 [Nanoarchaeota archaeon]|nr:hypothetical protein [Nanoarchaeota archaeon]